MCLCVSIGAAAMGFSQGGEVYSDSLAYDADTTHTLEEVLVLGNPVRQRQQEESLQLDVVSKDFIQRHLGGSLMHTLERLPGVQLIGIGSGQSKPLLRGMGFNRVVVLDKGVRHEGQQWGSDHGLELDQFAAGQVEILKGPASFVHGSDAIGGAIDVKPESPPAPWTVTGSVDLVGRSNNGLYGSSARLAVRGATWFADSRVTHLRYGDYRVPTDTVYVYDVAVPLPSRRLRNTSGNETNFHASVGYLGETFNSILYLSNTRSATGFFANAHGLEPRQVDAASHDRSSRDLLLPQQSVSHLKLVSRNALHLGQHHLEAELGYQRNDRLEYSEYVNHGYMPSDLPGEWEMDPNVERAFDKHVLSGRVTDYWKLGKHALMLGTSGEYQDNSIGGWTFLVPEFTQATAGVFVYQRFRIHDDLLLHGAVRYDYGRLRTRAYHDWFSSPVDESDTWVPLQRAVGIDRSFGSFVWSVGANYDPSPRWSFKANVGKSFRMPLAKELAASGVNYHYFSYEQGNPDLDAEQSFQADVALGWRASGWEVQLSPFFNYFPNYIYLNPTASFDHLYGAGNQVFRYASSEVMRYGGEMRLAYQPRPAWLFESVGEYLYATQLSGAKRGFPLPFSPPWSVLSSLTWSPKTSGLATQPYLSVGYRIVGRQERIVPPERMTDGYGVASLQAGISTTWLGSPVHLHVQVQNLLDTAYMSHTSFYRLIELPEMGRNVVVSLRIPFHKDLKKN